MRNPMLTSIILLVLSSPASALGINYANYHDNALIYTNSSFPQSVSKIGTNENSPIKDLSKLKRGESSTINVLSLVEKGDAGINKAMKNGNITKVYYIDKKVDKVYVPFLFIPFYLKERKTIVYGE